MATEREVRVPDIGTADKVDVIEILVNVGDEIKKDASLVTLEGDKATMELPAPFAGKVVSIAVKVGDKIGQGDKLLILATDAEENKTIKGLAEKLAATPAAAEKKPVAETKAEAPKKEIQAPAEIKNEVNNDNEDDEDIYAGPAVRRTAREFGIDLAKINGTGRKGRIQIEDVQAFVKRELSRSQSGSGAGLPSSPVVDFKQFGEIEIKPLTKIKKATAANLHRNWVLVPHVTQFEEADITELEAFRKAQTIVSEKNGIKLTLLAFVLKAVVSALKKYPQFNASLDANGENLIYKHYYHIGVAVDTHQGLVVPVIRDVNQKTILELAKELGEVSIKAREKGLSLADMQGGSFTISSLGGIGGTSFTPIVNLPDVAILGLSRAAIKPIYRDGEFIPRLMLPLSLSYDHRVIDGAEGARFTTYLANLLTDIKQLLL